MQPLPLDAWVERKQLPPRRRQRARRMNYPPSPGTVRTRNRCLGHRAAPKSLFRRDEEAQEALGRLLRVAQLS